LKPLFEKINVRLIADSGFLHSLAQIGRSSERFRLIDIFRREKQQHFIWVVGVAEKMFLFYSGLLPRRQVRIIDRFPFSEISDFVTN
jgi:hypothetical protein